MLQFIYNHTPIFFQNIMVSVQGKIFENQRYTKYYYNELNELRNCKNPFDLQKKRMKEFYNFIENNSKYYQETLKEFSEEIDLNKLSNYPILTKENVRTNIKNIVTKNSKDLITLSTGGSTGKSLKIYSSPYDMSRRIAYLDFFKEQHGVFKGMRRASIGGKKIIPPRQKRKIFWRYNKQLNQLLFSAYHADGSNLKYYVKQLNDFKPETIDGFPTIIHRIAKFILKNDITLTFSPIAIFPNAEALTDEMKEDIEKAFGCPVRNQYASSEGAPFITENIDGELEINPMSGYFELQKIEGKIYELIVTGFYTTTTPLFRYKIGDSLELYEELPENYTQKDIKIKRIIGRNNDFLRSIERGIVTNAHLSTSLKVLGDKVIDSQFVQNKLDTVEVKLVVDNKADKIKVKRDLEKELALTFGSKTNYDINFVDSIELTQGGKKRFTINNLK